MGLVKAWIIFIISIIGFITLAWGPIILRWLEEQEIKKQNEKRNNEINNLVHNLIKKYETVLYRKYKQTHYIDEYGKEASNGWDREISYFIEHVVESESGWFLSEKDKLLIEFLINNYMENIKQSESEETEIKTGVDYENYIKELLQEDNFKVNKTPTTGDQGVDLIAVKNNKRIAVQCKFYSRPVGNKAVQEVIAGKDYYECDYACVVSNNSYTPAAKKLASTSHVLLLSEDDIIDALNKTTKKKAKRSVSVKKKTNKK